MTDAGGQCIAGVGSQGESLAHQLAQQFEPDGVRVSQIKAGTVGASQQNAAFSRLPAQRIAQCVFPDPRITDNLQEEDFALTDTAEMILDEFELAVSAVKTLGQRKLAGRVGTSQAKRDDIAVTLAFDEIVTDGSCGLVTIFGLFGEQFLDDVGEPARN